MTDNHRLLAGILLVLAIGFTGTASMRCRWVWVDGKPHWVCENGAQQ